MDSRYIHYPVKRDGWKPLTPEGIERLLAAMKLYHHPLSPNVRRVRLTAAVLGLELEEQVVDFAKGEHKTPSFLAINPNGALPALVDGDFVLTESRAIMQYLAAQKQGCYLVRRF